MNAAVEVSTWFSLHLFIVIFQGPCVFCIGKIRELNVYVVGITTPAFLKS